MGDFGESVLTGIIPACAGSTGKLREVRLDVGDHPRMRGEHAKLLVVAPITKGSSPHARGAPVTSDSNLQMAGIIPACAGSTRRWAGSPDTPRDHPRMRGEHLSA